MAFYTVLTPPPDPGESHADRMGRVVFLKDGFALFAFIFTGLWLLAKRLWLAFALFVLLWALIGFGGRAIGISPLGLALAQGLIGLFLALEGNALIERKLIRKGWTLAAVVEGKDLDQVERRFFETLSPGAGPAVPASANGGGSRTLPAPQAPASVLGLFPEAQGRA